MDEWPAVLGSSPALPGSPEFRSLPTLVNTSLTCLRLVGILNNVMFKDVRSYCFCASLLRTQFTRHVMYQASAQ